MVLLVAKLETLAQRMLSKPITNRLKSQVAVQDDYATLSSPPCSFDRISHAYQS